MATKIPRSSSKRKRDEVTFELDDDDDRISSDDGSESLELEILPKKTPNNNKTPPKKPASTSSSRKSVSPEDSSTKVENDSFDVILPASFGGGIAGECTVMIEVNPEDAALLDYEGISGAIGRFEADHRGGKFCCCCGGC
jgi:hypothetical protein